jgi:hypothetical protein
VVAVSKAEEWSVQGDLHERYGTRLGGRSEGRRAAGE